MSAAERVSRGGHVVNGGNLGGVWVSTILVIDPSKNFDQWLFYSTFLTIEDNPMFSGNLHECVQALIVLFRITFVDEDIICNPNYTFAAFQDLVLHPLKDVLGTSKAQGRQTNL